MSKQDTNKANAAYSAVDNELKDGLVIGIGSGSTVVHVVARISERHRNGLVITACIPTSFQAQQLILDNKLPLGCIDQFPSIDLTFDGADEIQDDGSCIKGGGGCLLMEKVVWSATKRIVVVADESKRSCLLGTKWTHVPIEVLSVCWRLVSSKIEKLRGTPKLRMAINKAGPLVTDCGNLILDTAFDTLANASDINASLINIVGVVETGLFCSMADVCYIGMDSGVVEKTDLIRSC